jgi:hypothetical protein
VLVVEKRGRGEFGRRDELGQRRRDAPWRPPQVRALQVGAERPKQVQRCLFGGREIELGGVDDAPG